MDDRRWDQVAAATGIAFVVLLVIATFMVAQPPDIAAPAREVRSYFVDNKSGIQLQSWVYGIAGILFIWFAGTLRAFLARAEGEGNRLSLISFAGAIGTLATLVPSIALNLTIAYSSDRGVASGPVAQVLFEFASWFGVLVAFSIVVFVGAASLSAGRTGILPQWFAWAGLATAALFLLQSIDVFVQSDFFEPQGVLGYVTFFLFLLWILAASVLLLQGAGGTTRVRTRSS